ncbi:MAG: VOC family protein [Dehalococcoidia bacterium]
MFVTGINAEAVSHIHIITKDTEAVARFYEGVLGVTQIVKIDLTDWIGIRTLYITSQPMDLEYVQVTNPKVGVGLLLKNEPVGLNCISLKVPDLDKAIAAMEAAGFKNTGRLWMRGIQEAWFETKALGMQIELAEYPGNDIMAIQQMPGPLKAVVLGVEYTPQRQ